MDVGGEVVPKLGGQVQPIIHASLRIPIKGDLKSGSHVHDPPVGVSRTFNGRPPLADASFLANVDFLTRADEPDHDTPLRNALGKLDKVFGL